MSVGQLPAEGARLVSRKDRQFWSNYLVPATAILSLGMLAVAIGRARHWPFVHDAPLMHYIVFLIGNGFVPYRDIVDMNMPGSYIFEAVAMKVFGPGATGWLLLEFVSMAVLTAACAWVAGPKRRLAGILAASFTCIFKLADGPSQLGQRDWIVALLLVISFGCVMEFLRGGPVAWVAGMLFCSGLAATIKPPAMLLPLFVLCGLFAIHRKSGTKLAAILLWTLVGMVLPVAAVLLFLFKWHAFVSFVAVLRGLVPFYAATGKRPVLWLFQEFSSRIGLLLVFAVLMFLLNRRASQGGAETRKLRIERLFLMAACVSGFMLYVLQGKGFAYHIYAAVPFIALFAMTETAEAISARGARQLFAAFALVIIAVISPFLNLQAAALNIYPMGTIRHLQSDLGRLGGAQLSGQIQCLDMTMGGCINVLYRMKIVQSTGFLYDFYLFPAHPTPYTASLQERFFQRISSSPPRFLVLSSHIWPEERQGYDQLARWPLFQHFIADHYTVIEEFVPGVGDGAGYRIYQLLPDRGIAEGH